MRRLAKAALLILCLVLMVGCDNGGTGVGGSVAELGLSESLNDSVTLECLKIQWTIDGDNVQIVLFINNRKVDTFTLTADNPQKYFKHALGKCQAYGTLTLYAKSVWGSGRLDAQGVTTVKAGHKVTHTGTLATW